MISMPLPSYYRLDLSVPPKIKFAVYYRPEKHDMTHGINPVRCEFVFLQSGTVTELVDWAWRYGTDEGVKSITLDVDQSKNVITFTNTREDVNWLDGNSYVQNIFQ